MTNTKDNGGPAFPMPMTMMGKDSEHVANEPVFGMTLRDYYAAAALKGSLARAQLHPVAAAVDAFDYADAMLAERAKREKGDE